jgi:hypothetical protein
MIDTIRIIAPSEPACREYVVHLLTALGATCLRSCVAAAVPRA